MQYPSRNKFIAYASNEGQSKDPKMQDGFKFRSSGLAVQILFALKPELGVVKDANGPKEFQE
jgi:hypothetical protein